MVSDHGMTPTSIERVELIVHGSDVTHPSTNLAYRKPVLEAIGGFDETLALAGAVRDHTGTTLEFIIDGCLNQFEDSEIGLMIAMSLGGGHR